MPTKLKSRDGCWLARVMINGRQVDSKVFPAGRLKGPEWTAAKNWEVQRKKELMAAQAETQAQAQPQEQARTLSGFELLLAWGERYLAYAERTMSRATTSEKKTVMKAFFGYCREEGIASLEAVTRPLLTQWLLDLSEERGPDRANRYRQNLLAAWHSGMEAIEGFPQGAPALERIKPFPVDAVERYVPPEEDVIKVLNEAHGQDLVMLLTYYYTGARRGEVFRLTWADVNLAEARIRLVDHKAGGGRQRVRWLAMHPELVRALAWWRDARPLPVDNVFMQLQNDVHRGQPFTQRNKLMPLLCKRAGVRPFGFHALRHKAASIAFEAGGLNAAQILMGHSRATTTDRYVRSAGLYSRQDVITEALGGSGIGQAAEGLLEKEMPQEVTTPGANCKRSIVNGMLQ